MAKSVQINISADTKKAVKSMADLELESEKTLKTLNEMEEQADQLNDALKNVEVGTEAYEELRKELIKVNTEIKNQELAMEALDNEQVASELKSVAGGFVDMAGGMALVGAGNKSLEKVVQTMAQVEGATKIVTGAMEAYASLTKLSHTITTAYTAAINFLGKSQVIQAAKTKILTVAQTILNAVMNANPIMLIVSGIALLIAGIVALVMNIKKVIKWLKDMSKYLLLLLGPMGALILAWIELSKETDNTAQISKVASETIIAGLKAQISTLEDVNRQLRKNRDTAIKAYQDEIDALKALGKSTREIEEEKLQFARDENKLINENAAEIEKKNLEILNARYKMNFESFKAAEEYYNNLLKKGDLTAGAMLANIKEIQDARLKANEDARVSENEYNAFITQKRKEAHDAYMRQLEEQRRAEQKRIDDATKIYEKIDQIEIERMDDSLERDEKMLQLQFEQRIKGLNEAIPEEQKLIKLYEEQLLEDLSFARYKWNKKSADDRVIIEQDANKQIQKNARETTEVTLKDRIDAWQSNNAELISKIQESFAIAAESLNQIFSLAQDALNEQAEQASFEREQRYGKETEALKNQLANREIDQEEYENELALLDQKRRNEERMAARKAFNQDKAFRISQAIMGTAQAVISGLSAPFPLGVIQAGINAALGAAQIGIISSQKFRAAKGGIVPGQPSGVDSVDAMLAPGEAVINSTSTSAFAPLLSAINEAGGGKSLVPSTGVSQPQSMPVFPDNDKKIYVSVEEFKDVDKGVTRIEEQASF